MKKTICSLLFVSSLSPSVFAGTSSAGGMFLPEPGVQCSASDGKGHEVKLLVKGDASTGVYAAKVQEATLTGIFAPVVFNPVMRSEPSETQIKYQGRVFTLLINLATGTTSLPPMYQAKMKASGVAEGRAIAMHCQLLPTE